MLIYMREVLGKCSAVGDDDGWICKIEDKNILENEKKPCALVKKPFE